MTASSEDDLRERVRVQIRLQYGSIRKASVAGDVSNTTIGQWLRGDTTIDASDSVRRFGVKAFGWGNDWPESPPPSPVHEPADPTNGELLKILERMAVGIADTNALLRLIVHAREIELPPELATPPVVAVRESPARSRRAKRPSRRTDG